MRLGEFLRSAEISQVQFATLLGVQQATVSRYISGTKIPSATVVLKIRDLSKGAVALDDWAPEKKIRRRDALLPSNRTCASPASGSRTRTHAFTHGTSCPSRHRRTSPKCL
jgi:predicted transcriptional regulator